MAGWLDGWRREITQKAIQGALSLAGWMGPRGALELGRMVRHASCWAEPLRRRLACSLRQVGIPPREETIDGYFDRLGRWAGWSLAVHQHGFDGSGIASCFEADATLSHLDEAVARGKGVVLASPHLFGHEMAAAWIHRRHPVVAVVRESKDPVRAGLKQRWYEATGMETCFRARHSSVVADTLAYLRPLRAGKVLGITPDVLVPPRKGMAVRIFGRSVCLSPGIVLLALRSGAALVTCLGHWKSDPAAPGKARAVLSFSEPRWLPGGAGGEHVLREGLQTWVSSLEQYLFRHPENWMFWMDKRWTRVLQVPGARAA